jgi:hypothetical protein
VIISRFDLTRFIDHNHPRTLYLHLLLPLESEMRSLSLAVLVLLATTCISHYVIADDPPAVETDTIVVQEEQEDIYITIKQKYIDMAAEFCDCDDTYEPLCAKDGGNYANDCVRNCAGIEKAYDGICESTCFPPGKRNCNGDWDSTMPVCVFGLTFTNLAEAQCSGRALPGSSPLCSAQGVCEYGVRDGEVVTVLTTNKPRPGVACTCTYRYIFIQDKYIDDLDWFCSPITPIAHHMISPFSL